MMDAAHTGGLLVGEGQADGVCLSAGLTEWALVLQYENRSSKVK